MFCLGLFDTNGWLNHLFQKGGGKTASVARGMVELNPLFQKDRGKKASAARILSPNQMRRPLPCLLIKSFFYGSNPAASLNVKTVYRNLAYRRVFFSVFTAQFFSLLMWVNIQYVELKELCPGWNFTYIYSIQQKGTAGNIGEYESHSWRH